MKISLFAIQGIPLGKHNVKDPRLDQADKLAEASKKTYAQVDITGEEGAADADLILVDRNYRADLILKDLEFVETRLSRTPPEAEKAVLEKIKTLLENDQFMSQAGLSQDELKSVAIHSFFTNKPIFVAEGTEEGEELVLRAFQQSGYIC